MNKPIVYEKKERSFHKPSHSMMPNSSLLVPSHPGDEKIHVGGKIIIDFFTDSIGTVEGKADVRLLFKLPAWIFFGFVKKAGEFIKFKPNKQG